MTILDLLIYCTAAFGWIIAVILASRLAAAKTTADSGGRMTLDAAYLELVEQKARDRVVDAYSITGSLAPEAQGYALDDYGEFREALGARRFGCENGNASRGTDCQTFAPGRPSIWCDTCVEAEARLRAACAAVMEDR